MGGNRGNPVRLPLQGEGKLLDSPRVKVMPLFRRKKDAPASEHAVITHLPLSDDSFGTTNERESVFQLETRIEAAVAELSGEHDGNEFGGGEAVLYSYGPDADALLAAIQECLVGFPVHPGAFALKRYGRADDPDARSERVTLS